MLTKCLILLVKTVISFLVKLVGAFYQFQQKQN